MHIMNPLKKLNYGTLRLRILVIILTGVVTYKANAQSMGISNTVITPDNSSILEMRSTNKGMLLPRMTTTERDAISSPAVGLMVYNSSTNKFNFFNGTVWTEFGSGQSIISTLNNLSDPTQTFATGTTGTDFNISSITSTHTFNLPIASGSNTGKLSNTDWTIFNDKVATTRSISTTAPLTGGGDLSASRTLSISANGISNTLIRQSAALTVIGRSANSTGNVADIAAGTDGFVLRRSGTTLGFGTVATAGITDAAITYAKIQNISTNNRLLGRANAGAGATEEISLGTGLSLTGTTLEISSLPNEVLINSTINLSLGTNGTDVNVSGAPTSLGGNLTLNIPSASVTNRGLLTVADWNSFNSKQDAISGGASTIATSNLASKRVLVSDASGKVVVSTVTDTELEHLSGVTSAIQSQINAKENAITAGTTAQYRRGDKTWQTLNSTAVGLGNVPNIDATNAANLSSGSLSAARFGIQTVPIGSINASGTPSSANYLRGDGTWIATPLSLTSLNGLTGTSQTLVAGSSGTDFNISSVGSVHTFNLPIASGINTGKLSNADWTTFNNKQATLVNSAGLAAALSDETGTGLVVFSTSPTLTTPILGNATATSQKITGTAGAGFLELQTQSAAPSNGPANSIRLFSNAGALAWKRSDGFVNSITTPIITADRTYNLPDASGTVALTSDITPKWQPVTKSTTATLTNTENFVLGDCTSGSINITLPPSPTDGQEVVIVKSGTNENASVTIYPNSGQVIGQALTFWNLTERNQIVNFVYVAASNAWRITARSNFSALGYRKRGTVSPRYYTSPSTGLAMGTAVLAANTLYAMPMVIENAVTIDQLLINVTTAGTGSSVRVGIYDDNNNEPDQRIVDCGAISSATTGVKTYTTGLPISLPPGLYWLVAVCNTTAPQIRGFAVGGVIPLLGNDATLGTAAGLGYSVNFTYTALPTSFPASPTVRTAAPLPAIFVRYSD
jgi:hypothetical protein